VNEALGENGAQQSRPWVGGVGRISMRHDRRGGWRSAEGPGVTHARRGRAVRRRWEAAAWAKPGPLRRGASKAVGVAGEGQRCRAVGGEAWRACTAATHGPRG
jgi:hypothetical protein